MRSYLDRVLAVAQRYTSVAFDWDNTLVDNFDQLEASIRQKVEDSKRGVYVDLVEYEKNYSVFSTKGICSMISMLSSKIHIISNKESNLLAHEVDRVGISQFVLTITGSADKPNNPGVLTDIASTGLYVGDSTGDASVAKAAGWDFLRVTYAQMAGIEEPQLYSIESDEARQKYIRRST